MIKIGAIIKKYREQESLTQKELSEHIDVTSTYLSAIENGRKEPSLSLIRKISDALKTPYEVLMWESVEVNNTFKGNDKKIVEMAQVIIKNYYETINNNCAKV